MTKRERAIRKYMTSFEMTRREAETHYEKQQSKPKHRITLYVSEKLGNVTVPGR